MHLENIVMQARNPHLLGHFWIDALGLEVLTDAPELVEGRLHAGEMWLDLCLERHPDARPQRTPRLHLDLGSDVAVDDLLALGATHLDIDQGDVPWTVLADPEGNACCVLEPREHLAGTGPVAALPLDSADPARDREFWQVASGWRLVEGTAPVSLQHTSGRGPLLELCREVGPKVEQNWLHLDVRPDHGETQQECVARLVSLGGRTLDHDWGDLPWVVMTDPSGNELCVLAAEG